MPGACARAPRSAQQIVQEISWLLALTGPSVIAVDQIDTLIAQSVATGDALHHRSGGQDDPGRRRCTPGSPTA